MIIYLECTLNLMLQNGLDKKVKEIMDKGEIKTIVDKCNYVVIND